MKWARYCYRSPLSKWGDGYARGHWMNIAAAESTVAYWKSRGQDAFVEYQDSHGAVDRDGCGSEQRERVATPPSPSPAEKRT